MSTIYGNMVGGASLAQTYILQDSEGNEVTATLVDSETVFDATPNDIRAGKVAATETGVTIGTKEIPSYVTSEGWRLVSPGDQVFIPHTDYNYTKFQAIICIFNTSITDSVAAKKISVLDNVYDVDSTTALSAVLKDDTNARVDFGIINNSDTTYVVRYFMYKEIY